MKGSENGEPNCEYVLDRTQQEIRNRLWTCIGGQAYTGLGCMGPESESSSGQQGSHPNRRAEMRECGASKHRACRNADEGVDGIPDRIHDWDLVCEEFDQVHNPGNRDHPPL